MQIPSRIVAGKLCRLKPYLFTCAIEVGVRGDDHERRYCYEDAQAAAAALKEWNGAGHPPGNWIKCKSATQDFMNPEWLRAAGKAAR